MGSADEGDYEKGLVGSKEFRAWLGPVRFQVGYPNARPAR